MTSKRGNQYRARTAYIEQFNKYPHELREEAAATGDHSPCAPCADYEAPVEVP